MDNPKQDMRDVQHFGEEGGVVPAIEVAATSSFINPEDMAKTMAGEMEGCYLYSRHSNPTLSMFNEKIAAMDSMEAALGTASGMAAIACAMYQLMPEGGHIVSSRTIYGGTYALFANIFPHRNIDVTFVPTRDVSAFEKAITPKTKALYVEALSNPLLRVPDFKALSKIAKKHKIKLVVDNTFTPFVVSPAKLGADIILYSCTKYISGASDLVGGAIVGSKTFIDELKDIHRGYVMLHGPVMDSRIAHVLYLRLDHLPVRMAAHSKSALYLAERLEKEGINVIYPGLESHGQHNFAKEIMKKEYGFGGMVTIDCGSKEFSLKLAEELQNKKFGLYAVSLGFSRTLISCPAGTTSSEIPEEEREKMGLTDGLIRLSVGFTGDDEIMTERFLDCYKTVAKSVK
ncbi:aminotransferase class I/II-fold pyridoxal phosphate-dependent enzyme [Bdellovibrionota bacterium]